MSGERKNHYLDRQLPFKITGRPMPKFASCSESGKTQEIRVYGDPTRKRANHTPYIAESREIASCCVLDGFPGGRIGRKGHEDQNGFKLSSEKRKMPWCFYRKDQPDAWTCIGGFQTKELAEIIQNGSRQKGISVTGIYYESPGGRSNALAGHTPTAPARYQGGRVDYSNLREKLAKVLRADFKIGD